MQVHPSPGSKMDEAQTQLVADIVEQIAAERGVCQPDSLVEVARDPESPLHTLFDWNDKTAAHAHRLETARRLIRNVKFIAEGDHGAVEVHAFHHVRVEPRSGYVPIKQVIADRNLQQQVAKEAIRRLAVWRSQYSSLRSVIGDALFAQLEEVLEQHRNQGP